MTSTLHIHHPLLRRGTAAMVAIALGSVTMVASAAELTPTPVKADPTINEVWPAADGDWLSWGQNSATRPAHFMLYAQNGTGPRFRVNRAGTTAEGGGIDGRTLVYAEYPRGGDANLVRYDLVTRQRSGFARKVNTGRDEYRPHFSWPWVLFTRYTERTDTSQVLLYNMRSRVLRVVATEPYNSRDRFVLSDQVNGDYAVWSRERPAGWDVFRYHIPTKTSVKIPRRMYAQYSPSVASDGTVYFHRSTRYCGDRVALVKYQVGGPAEVLVRHPAGRDAGRSYVNERPDGSRDVYYTVYNCNRAYRRAWDIHKVVDTSNVPASAAPATP